MSKIKKAAAVVATAVLCMSMSIGVFASSPTDPEIPNIMWGGQVTDSDGDRVSAYVSTYKDVSEEVEKILQDEEQVKEILYEAGYTVKDNEEITVIAASDVELYDGISQEPMELPEGGVDLELELGTLYEGETYTSFSGSDRVEGIQNGDTLYILHQKADGTWEVLEGKAVVKDQNGYTAYGVSAHFDSLSPVAVIKIMSNGEVVVLDKDNNVKETITTTTNTTTTTNATTSKAKGDSVKVVKTTTEKKSPKTGN